MKYEVWVNVFGNEYMTESNPDGECYRDGGIRNSYEEAKALAYEFLVDMLQRYYKVSPDHINPSPAKWIYPFQETFDPLVPSNGYRGIHPTVEGR